MVFLFLAPRVSDDGKFRKGHYMHWNLAFKYLYWTYKQCEKILASIPLKSKLYLLPWKKVTRYIVQQDFNSFFNKMHVTCQISFLVNSRTTEENLKCSFHQQNNREIWTQLNTTIHYGLYISLLPNFVGKFLNPGLKK